jgi:hypothetical protein
MVALMKYVAVVGFAGYCQPPAHLHSPARLWTATFTPTYPTADKRQL